MRILFVVTGLSVGGAEKVVSDLADALVSRGDQVMLVYLKGPLQVRPSRSEVGLTCLGMRSPAHSLSAYLRLRRIVNEFRPDLVHGHLYHAIMLARLVRLTTPMPHLVSTVHTSHDGGWLRSASYRATDRLTDVSTCVSSEAAQVFVASRAAGAERVVAIHNGVATDRFSRVSADAGIRKRLSIDPDRTLFFAAGRLHRVKDYPNLFQALARLRGKLRFELLIAGDGPLRGELEELAGRLGLSSQVRFLGIREDIPALMAAADVFVLPSADEGFGLVVAEAMACECVVVATDCGGVREVLGNAGFLVPPRDPDALAAALLEASSLPREQAIAIGRQARQRVVEKYSFERSVEKWRELYARVADMPAASRVVI